MTLDALLSRVPGNTSFLQETKYTFIFPTLPFLNYFVTDVILPGVSTSAVAVFTPHATTYRHGDRLVYEEMAVTVLIDEDLRSWEETHDWLRGLTKPQSYEQYKRFYNPAKRLYHDSILTLNTNSNLRNIRVKFHECHPVSISGLQFKTSGNADTILEAEIRFRYDYYEFERLTP